MFCRVKTTLELGLGAVEREETSPPTPKATQVPPYPAVEHAKSLTMIYQLIRTGDEALRIFWIITVVERCQIGRAHV